MKTMKFKDYWQSRAEKKTQAMDSPTNSQEFFFPRNNYKF